MLDRLEAEADKLTASSSGDAMAREDAYRLAEELDAQLSELTEAVADTTRAAGAATERHGGSSNVKDLSRLVGMQVTALQWVEKSAADLETQLASAYEKFGQQPHSVGI
jgi:hypothetical protein